MFVVGIGSSPPPRSSAASRELVLAARRPCRAGRRRGRRRALDARAADDELPRGRVSATRAWRGTAPSSAAAARRARPRRGLLTQWASWRWGLFINVPIGAAMMWRPATSRRPSAARALRPRRRRHLDARDDRVGLRVRPGRLRRLGRRGTVASFALAVGLLAAFVLIERRAEQPITPLRLFASRERSGATPPASSSSARSSRRSSSSRSTSRACAATARWRPGSPSCP